MAPTLEGWGRGIAQGDRGVETMAAPLNPVCPGCQRGEGLRGLDGEDEEIKKY